jgi:anti-anti-sigma factor
MDSTGIGALVSIYNHANKADVIVILENVPKRVYKIMAITGLTTAFTIK